MKKQILVLLLLAFTAGFKSQAQTSYINGFGGAAYLGTVTDGVDVIPFSTAGFFYSGRYNFKEIGDNSSLSVACYPTANINFSANSRSGASGAFMICLPTYFMYNKGMLYNKYEIEGFGFFAGVGSEVLFDIDLGLLVGPSACGGLRFNVKERPYELKFAFTKDIMYNANLFSIGISTFFGLND